MIILEAKDKSGRIIHLANERLKHILKHAEMQHSILYEIEETLKNPLKITSLSFDENVKYYYKYLKSSDSKAKYLRVTVKYLNGTGFIITAYFVENIK